MKAPFQSGFIAISFAALAGFAMAETDCAKLAVNVKHAVEAKPEAVLEIVESRVAASPDCVCEVVKAAIEASEADASEVAAIVETAAAAAPSEMRLAAQCALAVAPDSLAEVQSVISRLEPGQGEPSHSGKSAKAKEPVDVLPAWNPLDFPGQGIGPTVGGPGGFPWLPPTEIPPVFVPPVINPPGGTETDF